MTTAITQSQIADRVGLTIPSVCKILNRYHGKTQFKEATIREVRQVARQMGWKPRPLSRHSFRLRLIRLFRSEEVPSSKVRKALTLLESYGVTS